jgi:hypothetical protein
MTTRERQDAQSLIREINALGYLLLFEPASREIYVHPLNPCAPVSPPSALYQQLVARACCVAAWLEESAL